MLTGAYRDLFTAVATSAAALTGLLFVVMTVDERRGVEARPGVVREVRASAALLAFTNALAVSLFSLVPGTNPGYPAVVVGVIGVFFSAAATRSLLTKPSSGGFRGRHVALTAFLLATFAVELGAGIGLLLRPRSGPLDLLSDLLVVSLLIGIARAWELVGGRDTGILASLASLTGHEARPQAAVRSGPTARLDEGRSPEIKAEPQSDGSP
jgi:hypothetical protein